MKPRFVQPDQPPSWRPVWFGVDLVISLLFVWVTVESLRSDAYVDQFGAVTGWGWLLAISPVFVIPVRRIAPATSLALATALYMVISAFQGDSNAPLAVPFFSYSVGLSRPPATSGWMVGVAAFAMSSSVFYGPGEPVWIAIPVTFLLFGVGWLLAVIVRRSQTRATELADEADELRERADTIAHEAVAEERSRIARELHDAVGHAVNVMVMQAGAARLTTSDDTTRRSLAEIERVGRTALTDLDHMLGLLHDGEVDRAPLAPARGSGDIRRLVAETRAGGADVRLDDRCGRALDDVDRQVGAAAYRIVQESLTNAIKHAGPAHIVVTLDCGRHDLTVAVRDDGRGVATRSSHGGRGIAGMTERAKLLGGDLSAGPVPSGGFEVKARLPRVEPRTSSGIGGHR